ncbi:MAG: bifunctional diaminohydroxyphosphoribosylaminopyrimidine deaminase/5-amino-6-(5-phosphoribosylamino)uracil reductase RibD [Bacteroidota bacterium]
MLSTLAAIDQRYLQRCADLAALADSQVRDNPRVGAVLVHQDRIIGEGYHQKAGAAHAEVNCLASVTEQDRALIPEATLYISLEPCCVTGRTGACTDLIQREHIKTVVFAQRDTTPGVDGESVSILHGAGVAVREYPDFKPTISVNAHRRTLTTLGRPRVILKYALSADGFIRPADREQSYWITGPVSRRLVHRWRANTAAVIVGGRTVVEDDPALTTRLYPGPNPRPVIIDLRDRCTGKERLFQDVTAPPLLFSGTKRLGLNAENIVLGAVLNKEALTQVLGKLEEQRYGEVTVEGGATLLNTFIATNLWDEVRIFTGTIRFGAGLAAPIVPTSAKVIRREMVGEDRLEVIANSLADQ